MFLRGIVLCSMALACVAGAVRPARAESLATVLEPITPRDQEVRYEKKPFAAVDRLGRLLVV
jgi:hypothetical protein